MREWADVYIESIDDRVWLQRFALFFVPSALRLMSQNGITKSTLATFAMNVKNGRTAGRQAVGKVTECKPVVYDSALGFVNAFNSLCERDELDARLMTSDIVACVFRLNELNECLAKSGISRESLHETTKIPMQIISAAANNFRLPLVDALKIHSAISQISNSSAPKLEEFIVVSEKLGRTSVKKINDDEYVYRRELLSAAPRSGHAWAIEESQP